MLPVIPTKSGDNMASKLTSLQSACKRSYAMIDSVKDYQARCQECGMFDEKEWHKCV
jgi:recombinational DNA repair protein RecR